MDYKSPFLRKTHINLSGSATEIWDYKLDRK